MTFKRFIIAKMQRTRNRISKRKKNVFRYGLLKFRKKLFSQSNLSRFKSLEVNVENSGP